MLEKSEGTRLEINQSNIDLRRPVILPYSWWSKHPFVDAIELHRRDSDGKRQMRLLHWFGRNVGRFLLRLLAGDDAWRRFATQLRPGAFGGAERTPLALLQFRSTVPVKSATDVAAWLAGCKKVSSAEMRFGARTPMELASSLERDRQGNCQAHACWAFARLAQLHLNPTTVVGKWDETTTPGEFHVWVLFEENQRVFLMETMELALERAIQPFAAAKGHYRPLYAASASGASFVYRDYVHARLLNPAPSPCGQHLALRRPRG